MTSTAESAAESANESAKEVARSTPLRIGARFGIVAYGLTHLLIAWLALQIAFGGSSQKADQNGAFQALAEQPLGRVLLWVLVLGFAATAVWRLTQAIWGFGYLPDQRTAIRRRVGSGFKAVLYAALGVLAGRTAAGAGGGGGPQNATAGVLGLPGGQLLVGAVGVGIGVVGVVKAVQGWKKAFRDDMDMPLDRRARRATVRTGQVGFIAKGVSVALIGALVVVAAVRFRPEEASGLDAGLRALAAQPFGPYLLTVVALGLAVYGVFCFVDARYHRV
jgi:hypothetical protein